jgi:geranylgeranyl reductase family protein
MHDVVIVGAGIGGSSTAFHLAQAGVRVLMLDRAVFPRRKVCGEGIMPQGVRQLENMGVAAVVLGAGAALDRLQLHLGSRAAQCKFSSTGQPAVGIKRPVLDQILLERARRAGAEVAQGITVTGLIEGSDGVFAGVTSEQGPFEARAIIAADGLRSRLRRLSGLDAEKGAARYGANAHAIIEGEGGDCVDVYIERDFELYLTPVSRHEVNVALLLNRAAALSCSGDLPGRFRQLVGQARPGARYELTEEPRLTGPFPSRSSRASQRNLLLVGDAAGFFDGISGEGMSLALRTAPLAAKAIRDYLATGSETSFQWYHQQVLTMRRPSTIFARMLLGLTHSPALASYVLRNLARRPDSFGRFLGVSDGELRFRDLRPRDLVAVLTGL